MIIDHVFFGDVQMIMDQLITGLLTVAIASPFILFAVIFGYYKTKAVMEAREKAGAYGC